MADFSGFGKILIIIGLVIAGLGFLLLLGGKMPWLGKLPGDFFYKGKNFTFYFPLATCIIISIVLMIILMFIGRK
jgi:ABC-type Na+ efflux pump permease subunit